MATDLTKLTVKDGIPLADTRLMALGLGIEHKNLLDLINEHKADIEEFGLVAFQTEVKKGVTRGTPAKYGSLNRAQVSFVIMLTRNTPEAISYKKALTKRFIELEQELSTSKHIVQLVEAGDKWVEEDQALERDIAKGELAKQLLELRNQLAAIEESIADVKKKYNSL